MAALKLAAGRSCLAGRVGDGRGETKEPSHDESSSSAFEIALALASALAVVATGCNMISSDRAACSMAAEGGGSAPSTGLAVTDIGSDSTVAAVAATGTAAAALSMAGGWTGCTVDSNCMGVCNCGGGCGVRFAPIDSLCDRIGV